jgi:hypothetical protein
MYVNYKMLLYIPYFHLYKVSSWNLALADQSQYAGIIAYTSIIVSAQVGLVRGDVTRK